MKKIIASLYLFFGSYIVFSQSNYPVGGKVIDAATKLPMQAASVFGENTTIDNSIISNSIIQSSCLISNLKFNNSMLGSNVKAESSVLDSSKGNELNLGDYSEIIL